MSHWTSEAAAADLSSLCARRVPTLAQDRAKSQPKPGSVNQPAGWTATSTARPAEVWKGARDALDCEEQQQRGAERKRQPHWTEEVATATLMAPLHSSSSRSSLTCFGVGCPCPDHGTERPWADPSHTPRSHPPCSRAAHTRSKKSSAPPAAIKFCIAWQFDGSGAASIPEPSTPKIQGENRGCLECVVGVGFGPSKSRRCQLLHP